jgi:hypothetical protein
MPFSASAMRTLRAYGLGVALISVSMGVPFPFGSIIVTPGRDQSMTIRGPLLRDTAAPDTFSQTRAASAP